MNIKKMMQNPLRVQILQYLMRAQEATTKQIADAMPDVPQPTLYRHIGAMLKDELLLVKEERRVRGSMERLLTINTEALNAQSEDHIGAAAGQFLMDIYADFQKYAANSDCDPMRDMLMLRTCSMMLTDKQYAAFLSELGEIIEKYMQVEDRTHGKARSLSLVSAPVFEEASK